MTEKEIEGNVVNKYSFFEPLQLSTFFGPPVLTAPASFCVPIKRNGYEIDSGDAVYDLSTLESCDIPIGARVKITVRGRIFKEICLLYGGDKFPVTDLMPSQKKS